MHACMCVCVCLYVCVCVCVSCLQITKDAHSGMAGDAVNIGITERFLRLNQARFESEHLRRSLPDIQALLKPVRGLTPVTPALRSLRRTTPSPSL